MICGAMHLKHACVISKAGQESKFVPIGMFASIFPASAVTPIFSCSKAMIHLSLLNAICFDRNTPHTTAFTFPVFVKADSIEANCVQDGCAPPAGAKVTQLCPKDVPSPPKLMRDPLNHHMGPSSNHRRSWPSRCGQTNSSKVGHQVETCIAEFWDAAANQHCVDSEMARLGFLYMWQGEGSERSIWDATGPVVESVPAGHVVAKLHPWCFFGTLAIKELCESLESIDFEEARIPADTLQSIMSIFTAFCQSVINEVSHQKGRMQQSSQNANKHFSRVNRWMATVKGGVMSTFHRPEISPVESPLPQLKHLKEIPKAAFEGANAYFR